MYIFLVESDNFGRPLRLLVQHSLAEVNVCEVLSIITFDSFSIFLFWPLFKKIDFDVQGCSSMFDFVDCWISIWIDSIGSSTIGKIETSKSLMFGDLSILVW